MRFLEEWEYVQDYRFAIVVTVEAKLFLVLFITHADTSFKYDYARRSDSQNTLGIPS